MENVVFEQFKFAESPWDRVCSLKFLWAQLLIWIIHIFFNWPHQQPSIFVQPVASSLAR